jgi:DNA polymerase III subunit epsilon
MIFLALDFETTGLDPKKDSVIEVGAVLWSVESKRTLGVFNSFVRTDIPITPEITNLTGITAEMLLTLGVKPPEAFQKITEFMETSDAIVGHNVVRFDKLFWESWARKNSVKCWCDTYTDLPREIEPKSLTYMAADHGFLNPFPHSALSDCLTVVRLISMYDANQLLARAREKTVVMKAHVTFDNNALAKQRKYKWNPERKIWWKTAKESDFPIEASECPFTISTVDIDPNALWPPAAKF